MVPLATREGEGAAEGTEKAGSTSAGPFDGEERGRRDQDELVVGAEVQLGRGLLERRIPYAAMLWALSPIRDMSRKDPPSLLRPALLGDTEAPGWLRYRRSCTEVRTSAVQDEALWAFH